MELITLFRFVEALLQVDGGSATLSFSTDLPGNLQTVKASAVIPATNGRHPYRLQLPGATKGKLYQVSIVPVGAAAVRIYAAKVFARVIGMNTPTPSPWQWYAVPVLETPVEWQAVKLPIPATSDDWQEMKLPIPATPDDWQAVKLPIPETSDQWQEISLPVKPTPVVPEWVNLPIDS